MASHDYYATLGVDRRAGPDEIKKAFRRLTREWHPDRHPDDPEVAQRYRRINEAYNTLSDSSLRSRYDMSQRLEGIELRKGFDGRSARDLLGNVFGDVFGTKRDKRRRGRDLRYTLTIPFEDAIKGCSRDIEFDAPGPCPTCRGGGTAPGGRKPETCSVCGGKGEVKGEGLLSRRSTCGRCNGMGLLQLDPCKECKGKGTRRQTRAFAVKVPPATEAGSERVIEGEGEPGRFHGDAGDLRVTVNIEPHPWLRRKGDEIHCDVPLSIFEAAKGAKVPVPTVDGLVEVDVPPGVRSGTRLRLRGKGVPSRGNKRGDQFVVVVVETPVTSGFSEVTDALERLEAACVRSPSALPLRTAQRKALDEDGD